MLLVVRVPNPDNPKNTKMKQILHTLLKCSCLFAFAFLTNQTAMAATAWSGSSSTDWDTSGNWTSGVPVTGATTTINTSTGNMPVISNSNALSGLLTVGNSAGSHSILTIQNGKTLTTDALAQNVIGNTAGSYGQVDISGTGSAWNTYRISVGVGGTGVMNLTNGATVTTSSNLYVGDWNAGNGTANVNSSTLTVNGVIMGNSGSSSGTITVSNGGLLSTINTLSMGQQLGSQSTITVTGTGSKITAGTTVIVGNKANSTLKVLDGGNLTVGFNDIILGAASGVVGTLEIGNGAGAGSVTMTHATPGSITTSNGSTGVVAFNHTNSSYTFATKIAGSNSVTHSGNGTTTLTGSNSYTGTTSVSAGNLVGNHNAAFGTSAVNVVGGTATIAATRSISNAFTVNAGTLIVSGTLTSGGSLTFGASGGTIKGSGTIAKSLTLSNVNQILAPGNSPGIQLYAADQTWNSMTYQWELNSWNGTTAGTDFDQIGITGALDLSGASANSLILDITSLTAGNAPGTVPGFSEINRSWTIATATGGITGFSSSDWQIVTGNFLPATYTGAFSLGLANANQDLVLSYGAVPEPTGISLLVMGLLSLVIFRRRKVANSAN